MEMKSENTEEKQDKRKTNPNLFQPGQSGNPNGRPKGSLSFSTKWTKFIEKVAKQNGIKPEDIDDQMFKVAYKEIMSADHKFWKDIMDRVYGQATQNIEVKAEMEIDDKTREKAESVIRDL